MTWALQIKPTVTYKPQKVKGPEDLLEIGDVVNWLKDVSKKDQLPYPDQEPLAQEHLTT
jgi:hypothetical protein